MVVLVGETLGSRVPGAIHLINGLYEAREGIQSVLAILSSCALKEKNMTAFLEMNQNE